MQYWTRTNLPLSTGSPASNTSEYNLLQGLITAAENQFYKNTDGYVVNSSGWQLPLDYWSMSQYHNPWGVFPIEMLVSGNFCGVMGHPPMFYLALQPITAVTEIQYLDTTNTWQTLEGWTADTYNTPARINLPTSLPTLSGTQLPRVLINFTAGNAQGNCPPDIQFAIKVWANSLYENRTMTKHETSMWEDTCDSYRTNIVGNWNQ